VTDFAQLFGGAPEVQESAPGRVNLIGEHTDYNGGLVLPTAIPQRTRVALARRRDRRVRAWSREAGGAQPATYDLGAEARSGGWLDYVQGVTAALAEAGFAIGGFELRVESDVPVGSGLSSSAALEVAVLRGLRALFALELDDVALARLAQRGENQLVGAPVGILDPLAASLAEPGSALLFDTRTLAVQPIALPRALELIVIASGIAHDHASGDYRTRRAECERAAELLGVACLSDLGESDLPRAFALPAPLGRRVRHVVRENARVRATVAAFAADDVAAIGRAFAASHASLRDDYQVSIPEIDRLVAIAAADRDVAAARLTGGGFGGSIVALARRGTAEAAARRIMAAYGAGRVMVPEGTRG
jgi:galactokinase